MLAAADQRMLMRCPGAGERARLARRQPLGALLADAVLVDATAAAAML
jgi:hypothetical protein